MRALLAAFAFLAGSGCVWQSGPDCAAACAKLVACPGVSGTFRLSCNSVNGDCFDQVAVCAQCIADHDCADLDGGACDSVATTVGDGSTTVGCRFADDGGS